MSSRTRCSSSVSTSWSVETTCCASTQRQKTPCSGFRSERSAPGIQVGKAMRQSCNRLDLIEWPAAQRPVLIAKPCVRHFAVAACDRIERTEQANEQRSQLERLGAFLETELVLAHPGDRRFRNPQNRGEVAPGDTKLLRCPDDRHG